MVNLAMSRFSSEDVYYKITAVAVPFYKIIITTIIIIIINNMTKMQPCPMPDYSSSVGSVLIVRDDAEYWFSYSIILKFQETL